MNTLMLSPRQHILETDTESVSSSLSLSEKQELEQHEAIISKGLETFFDVGAALTNIRDKRLYRETHKTFELYCRNQWMFSKTHANRMIAGASVLEDLAAVGAKPKNLEQTKPLARLNSDQRREAWSVAQERAAGREVTGFDLNQAADQVAPKVKSEPHVPTKEEMARYTKSKRDKERRDQKRKEEEEKDAAKRRKEWAEGFHIVAHQFERNWENQRVFKDLAQALEFASDRASSGVETVIFQGDKWAASVFVRDDEIKFKYRDDAEGDADE